MNRDEIDRVYSELSAMLREAGLDWLVAEVERDVRHGATVKLLEPAQLLERTQTDASAGRRGRLSPRNVTREWSAEERLSLLLDATDSAVCGPVFLVDEVFRLFPDAKRGVISLAADEAEADEIRFAHEDVATRLEAAQALRRLLNQVREEIHANLSR